MVLSQFYYFKIISSNNVVLYRDIRCKIREQSLLVTLNLMYYFLLFLNFVTYIFRSRL